MNEYTHLSHSDFEHYEMRIMKEQSCSYCCQIPNTFEDRIFIINNRIKETLEEDNCSIKWQHTIDFCSEECLNCYILSW
jgi:hypothetical protein